MASQMQQLNILNSVGTNNRPPLLNIDDFDQWTKRMKQYMIGISPDVWRSILTGPHNAVPTEPPAPDAVQQILGEIGSDGRFYTTFDLEKMDNDRKAMREITNAVPPDLFRFVNNCETAKEIYDMLVRMFQDDASSRLCKRKSSIAEFENFRMMPGESLKEAFNRFNIIITDLHNVGHVKDNYEVNLKFVNSLGKEWKMVRISMEANKVVETCSMYTLFCLLRGHEAGIMKDKLDEEEEKKSILGGSLALVANSNMLNAGTDADDERDYEEAMHALALYGGPGNKFQKFVRKPSSYNNFRSGSSSHANNSTSHANSFKNVPPPSRSNSSPYQKYDNPKPVSSGSEAKIETPKVSDGPGDLKKYVCYKCGQANHLARHCLSLDEPVKDAKFYANLAKILEEEEELVVEKPKDKAFVARKQVQVEVWSSGDESSEDEAEPAILIGKRGPR